MSIEIGSTVSAAMAVLSALAAVFAWWRSNLSKQAKADAEAARERAERQVQAAQEQAQAARESAAAAGEQVTHLEAMLDAVRAQSESLDQIAGATARRPLEAEHVKGLLYRLRNNTDADMVIEQVDNRAKFIRLDWLDAGTVVPTGESIEFRASGASGLTLPTTLIVGMVGEDRPRPVELPPRSNRG
jgi:hypothetical protein